jgi:hypothetical protein
LVFAPLFHTFNKSSQTVAGFLAVAHEQGAFGCSRAAAFPSRAATSQRLGARCEPPAVSQNVQRLGIHDFAG